jgi:A/G-specific adenine glycosylase
MLQQTQVERVIPYWERWLARWPDAASLAVATPAEAIQEWSGLGYNRRALNLHRTAKAVLERHGGGVPGEVAKLRSLPGVGEYTAAAMACFAGGQRVAVVDTNIARVMARVALGTEQDAVALPATRAAAEAALPASDPREWNLALMDLGAVVCGRRRPQCDACPVQRWCGWHARGRPAASRPARTTVPFEQTARYARGRIVDALRDRPRSAMELAGVGGEKHRADIERHLAALAAEGMIEAIGSGWRLPGDPRPVTPG